MTGSTADFHLGRPSHFLNSCGALGLVMILDSKSIPALNPRYSCVGRGEVDDARIEYDFDAALREIASRRYSDVAGTNQIGGTETAYDDTGRRVRITHLDDSNIVLANYEYEFDP